MAGLTARQIVDPSRRDRAGMSALVLSPCRLGTAALRVGARHADTDLGLALAAVGLVLASMPHAPRRVDLPSSRRLAGMLPDESCHFAERVHATAEGIVGWLAAAADLELAAVEPAGSA